MKTAYSSFVSRFAISISLISTCLVSLNMHAQMRLLSVDSLNTNNVVKNICFYSNAQGYIACKDYVGFTSDSGRTFSKKFITNINYNGYSNVNFLYGFVSKGLQAFDQNNLIVYGDIGFVPAILLSTDGGNSYLLTYHSQYDPFQLSTGIMDMIFPENNNIGYAVDADRILKTNNRGISWAPVYTLPNSCFDRLSAVSTNQVYAISDAYSGNIPFPNGRTFNNNKIAFTTNAGSNWQQQDIPVGSVNGIHYYTSAKGFVSVDNRIYFTSNGGTSWVQKNNAEFFPATFDKIKFFNDSLGYGTGGRLIYRTNDSGKIWEPLSIGSLSADYIDIEDFFFRDKNLFWAGGYHNLFAITTDGGGYTRPKAVFKADLTQLESSHLIKLVNYSKSGYNYKWFKNSVLLSTGYDAGYISERLYIDTVRLIVSNAGISDTSTVIIDTRQNQSRCFAAYLTSAPDTSAVKFTGQDSSFGVTHYWNFGDGGIDSTHRQITHNYFATGTYTIVHKVYNSITRCSDSLTNTVTIARVKNCLVLNVASVADSFYTNKYQFKLSFDGNYESGYFPLDSVLWNFGDNTAPGLYGLEPKHNFDSSKYYNVCVSVKNAYTGCKITFCKPVFVFLETTCEAFFTLQASSVKQRTKYFDGKPNAVNKGKRNTWLFDKKDTIVTNNTNAAFYTYFDLSQNSLASSWNTGPTSGGSCDRIAIINIDSLNRQVKHLQYDSATQCTDSMLLEFPVKTYVINPRIKVIQDPDFPNHFTYQFYETRPFGEPIEIPYYSRYAIKGQYSCGYGLGNCGLAEAIYSSPGGGYVAIAAPDNSCSSDRFREVYYKTHPVNNFDSCVIYPPKFSFKKEVANPYTFNFYDSSWSYNNFYISVNPTGKVFFGDGDSLSNTGLNFSHTYKRAGSYSVIFRYSITAGCTKTVSKQIIIPAETCANGNMGIKSTVAGTSFQWQVNTGNGFTNINNNSNYSGTNGDSLTIVSIPAAWSGYQYRCVVNGNNNSNPVDLHLTNVWTGTEDNSWENPANWSCGKIPDSFSYVKINNGTVNLSTNTTIRSLELNAGITLTINNPAILSITIK